MCKKRGRLSTMIYFLNLRQEKNPESLSIKQFNLIISPISNKQLKTLLDHCSVIFIHNVSK